VDFLPRVVLLDIGLPEMNGYEVARRFRLHPQLKDATLIAVTGYGQDSDRQRSKEAGFDDHMVKPVKSSRLLKVLADLTAKSSCCLCFPRSAPYNAASGGEAENSKAAPHEVNLKSSDDEIKGNSALPGAC